MAPPWTAAWDETKPADSDLANTLGSQGRNQKRDERERLDWQHVWGQNVNDDGGHRNIVIASAYMAANTEAFKASGFSLTGANAQNMVDLAGTWNTSGAPTGIKLNITNTASGAAALLLDLQIGGSSKFSVGKGGLVDLQLYKEKVNSVAIAANDIALNLASGNHFFVTLNANVNTITLSNLPANGVMFGFTLETIGDGTARSMPTPWFTGLVWASGSQPTPTSTNAKKDRYIFQTRDGGTTWLGAQYGQNF